MSTTKRTATLGVLLASVFAVVSTRDAAAQSCDPPPITKEELRQAAMDFFKYWAEMFPKDDSGTLGLSLIFDKGRLPQATKKCDRVVEAAGNRKEIGAAARLVVSSYAYACDNFGKDKAKRERPTEAAVAGLLGELSNGITEGALMKCFYLAHVRLQIALGMKPVVSEAEVQAAPDLDWDKIMSGIATAPQVPNESVDEHVIHIKKEGGLELDGKDVKQTDLAKVLNELAKKKRKARLLVTLQTDEQAKYEWITTVMDALTKAGITNVTFTVGTAEM
jgi:hypothetical protein